MSGELIGIDRHRRRAGEQHRIRRFAFRPEINYEAQKILADLLCQLNAQQDGLIDCRCRFDPATGEWIEHLVWRADRAPRSEECERCRPIP